MTQTTEIEKASLFDVQKIRKDFPILLRTMNGKPLIYFDNGANTQKPKQVIDAIVKILHRAECQHPPRGSQYEPGDHR